MKVLAEISEATLGLNNQCEQLGTDYRLRKSARAILLNEQGEMATQFLETYNYHKLPGGGVDAGETVAEALQREVLEEVGCQCVIETEVGMVIEYRNKYQLLHISYCYVARVNGALGEAALEAGEIEEGQVTRWVPPADVFARMQNDQPQKFEGYFILAREKAFLAEYLQSLE